MPTANATTGISGAHLIKEIDPSKPAVYDKTWCDVMEYERTAALPVQFKTVFLTRLLSVERYDFLARKILEDGARLYDEVLVGHPRPRCIIMKHGGREYVQIGHRYLVRKTIEEEHLMPSSKNYVRDYKQEAKTAKARGEHEDRMERQRARRAIDKTGVDRNDNGIADRREGKDVSHNKMMKNGGTNADGYKLESPSKNRSRNGHKPKKK